ncbi:MAG TPA: 50S ribosomal protein L4 [Ktedonobacteraceae bacterium]|jgi:large subunit ribosomal protein L4|nr:50S ribosomal protein L4 [Ktedonobacteraceae bacterium]
MPSTTVYNMAGEAVEELELSEQVFGVIPNVPVLHQVVTAQLVNRRQGNASTKTRSEVSGGNKKPYRQKGTGRARQGSIRAPQFRHGGVVWGPRPHSYHHDVPKKMRRLAIRSALSDKVANEQLVVVENLTLDAPRTKDMVAILEKLPSAEGKKVLMMLPRRDENVVLSTRNIPTAKVQHVSSINVVELLKHDYVIMPKMTVRWIEMVFGEGLSAEEASRRIAEELDAAENTQDSEETAAQETTDAEEPAAESDLDNDAAENAGEDEGEDESGDEDLLAAEDEEE